MTQCQTTLVPSADCGQPLVHCIYMCDVCVPVPIISLPPHATDHIASVFFFIYIVSMELYVFTNL